MSYVVLARKYRPPNFTAMVGQEHVVQALTNALTQRRLHHAYLFTGTRGVGKTTVSRILAKSLNCTGPDGQGGITAQPCGVCHACRDIDAGRFVDYVELDAASNRGVDEISQLLDQAVYKPVVGRFKVYMIDEVHMLSNTAFNAMLKTLEEPPEYLKFVLATTDPQKVPPTVLSRCLQFNLRPMAPQTVHEYLAEVLQRESIDAEPGALRLLARAAHGSMRDALSLTDQAIAFGNGGLTEAGVRQMLGAVDRGHAVRIVQALADANGAALVEAADALRKLGLSAAATLEEIATLLQQMAVLQAVPDAADPDDPDAPDAARLAGLLAADEVQLYYSLALHGRAEIGLAPDEYSALVMTLLRMYAFRPGATSLPQQRGTATSRPVDANAVAAVAAVAAPERSAPPASARPVAPRAAPSTAVPAAMPAAARAVAPAAHEPPPWLDADDPRDEPIAARTPARNAAGSEPRDRAALVAADPSPIEYPSDRTSPDTPPTAAAIPIADFPAEGLGRDWADLVQRMVASGRIQAMTRELAMQAQCLALGGDTVRLRVEREMLRAPANVEKLQAALADTLGRPVRVEAEGGAVEDTPARREAAARAQRQAAAEQIIHNDPLVRALMAQYKTARIVPGSVKPH